MICSYCGGTEFLEGPSGGLSVNVLCANKECRHWFNYALGNLDDLNKVEPSDEEKAQAAKDRDGTMNLGEPRMLVKLDVIYQEGRELFQHGKSARDCLQEGPYGGYGAAQSNMLRLTGFIDAMKEEISGT